MEVLAMSAKFLKKLIRYLILLLILFFLCSRSYYYLADLWETKNEIVKEKEKEKAEIVAKEVEKKEYIEKRLAEGLGIKSLYNFGREPEFQFVNDKEIYVLVRLPDCGDTILIKTIDGGENWEIILKGSDYRYLGKLTVKSNNSEKNINIYLDLIYDLRAQSEDDGKTWKYFSGDKEVLFPSPPIKDGILGVNPFMNRS